MLSSLCHWVSALVPLQSCQCLAWKPCPVVAWGAESQHVVAGYSDGTIRVFSISRTEMELKMHPHAVALTAIAYSTDGEAACYNSGETFPRGAWLGCAWVTLTSGRSVYWDLPKNLGPGRARELVSMSFVALPAEHVVNGTREVHWQWYSKGVWVHQTCLCVLLLTIYSSSSSAWSFNGCLRDISSYPALDSDVPSLSWCFGTPVSHDLGPFSYGLFLLLQEVSHSFLFPLPTGEMILSGGKDGLVAVSSPRTGMTIRVLADHKGSPITILQCTRKQVRPHPLPRRCAGASPRCVTAQLWEAAWPGRSASLLRCPLLFLFGTPSPPITSVQFF